MIDISRIVGFGWDGGNARKNDKHHVLPAEAEQVFFDPRLLLVDDIRHSGTEPRNPALGCTETERLLHVTFTLRNDGTLIRVISARDATRKERKWYEGQT